MCFLAICGTVKKCSHLIHEKKQSQYLGVINITVTWNHIIFLCHTGIFEDCKGDGNLIVIMKLILCT